MRTVAIVIAAAAAGFALAALAENVSAETPAPALTGQGGAAAGFSGQEGTFILTTQDGPSSWIPELILIRNNQVYRVRLDQDPPKELKPWASLAK
jgi:hypothetical protein